MAFVGTKVVGNIGNIPLIVTLDVGRTLILFDRPHYISLTTEFHCTKVMVSSMILVPKDISLQTSFGLPC